jgi:hypothetical protein
MHGKMNDLFNLVALQERKMKTKKMTKKKKERKFKEVI